VTELDALLLDTAFYGSLSADVAGELVLRSGGDVTLSQDADIGGSLELWSDGDVVLSASAARSSLAEPCSLEIC
jgi:hypothetical protein